MATVWLAERVDGLFERQVAIKLPHPQLAGRNLLQLCARARFWPPSSIHWSRVYWTPGSPRKGIERRTAQPTRDATAVSSPSTAV
jgi:hypothetical protein